MKKNLNNKKYPKIPKGIGSLIFKNPKDQEGSRILFIGRSGTGKTTALVEKVLNFWHSSPQKPDVYLITPNMDTDTPYQKLQKKIKIKGFASTINEEVVNKLFNKIKCPKKCRRTKKKKRKPNIVIIDDFGSNTYLRYKQKDNKFNDLITSARQDNTHYIFSVQRMKQLTPLLRENSDRINSFRIDNRYDLDEFFKQFMGEYERKECSQISTMCWSQPYNYLAIDRTDPYNKKYFHNEREMTFNRGGENL